jgi:nucleotide-binding universal stress UspA family protein
MLEIKKILCPIDLTKNSSRILPYVLSVADKYKGSICLLHVVEDVHSLFSAHVGDIPHDQLEEYRQRALKRAEKTMDWICEEQLESCPHFEKRIVFGNPTMEILKMVESEDIDLVIIGTHGSGETGQFVMGSVADNVLRSSPVPVLIVNPAGVKQQEKSEIKQQAA